MMRQRAQWVTLAAALLQGGLIVRRAALDPAADHTAACAALLSLALLTCVLLACQEPSQLPAVRAGMPRRQRYGCRAKEVGSGALRYLTALGLVTLGLLPALLALADALGFMERAMR